MMYLLSEVQPPMHPQDYDSVFLQLDLTERMRNLILQRCMCFDSHVLEILGKPDLMSWWCDEISSYTVDPVISNCDLPDDFDQDLASFVVASEEMFIHDSPLSKEESNLWTEMRTMNIYSVEGVCEIYFEFNLYNSSENFSSDSLYSAQDKLIDVKGECDG